ncbi:hypothetical protein F4778DRAFT_785471 [Xylariomycetidae sp. FL2044]|nr:hypothetical protein F4778DRAFT_785471 [Xylariomycetidae sp. FL2044]
MSRSRRGSLPFEEDEDPPRPSKNFLPYKTLQQGFEEAKSNSSQTKSRRRSVHFEDERPRVSRSKNSSSDSSQTQSSRSQQSQPKQSQPSSSQTTNTNSNALTDTQITLLTARLGAISGPELRQIVLWFCTLEPDQPGVTKFIRSGMQEMYQQDQSLDYSASRFMALQLQSYPPEALEKIILRVIKGSRNPTALGGEVLQVTTAMTQKKQKFLRQY